MAHVVVGERLAGAAPHIVGHIIAGAGHFVESAGGLFQSGAMNVPAIPIIARSAINDLSTPIAAERYQWQRLDYRYGNGPILAGSGNESSAWDRFMDHPSTRNNAACVRDMAIASGSFMAGDWENAIGYGASALEKGVTGTLKDLGFMGGWGGGYAEGPLGPLIGTWQETGAGRDH